MIIASAKELYAIVSALTPIQRWEALRHLDTHFMTQRWFIIFGIIVIAVLTLLLFWVNRNLRIQRQKADARLFAQYSGKRGLSRHERQILKDIALCANLKQSESIFTLPDAFDRGTAKLIDKCRIEEGVDESNQLKIELSFIREKLGFFMQKEIGLNDFNSPGSRQIPPGSKLHLINHTNAFIDVQCTVLENSEMGLTVSPEAKLNIDLAQAWRARFNAGSSIFEFDTYVTGYNDDTWTLSHAYNARFIDRRRFLRVPTKRCAFIASFPFNTTLTYQNDLTDSLTTPKFFPAYITELAGPGLRVDSPLEFTIGNRVLVVFNLNENLTDIKEYEKGSNQTLKIAEDIGIVRSVQKINERFSVAVELIGLKEKEVDILIQETNAAARIRGSAQNNMKRLEKQIPFKLLAQGVQNA
jgi:hypothetical protein